MFNNLVRFAVVVAASTSLLVVSSPASAQKTKGVHAPITVQWLGHAAFEITSSGGTRILIDPFLSGNPSTPDSLKAISRYKPAAILVSHSHSDHALDAKAIAVSSGAMVISAYEWVNTLGLPERQAMGGNVGGTITCGMKYFAISRRASAGPWVYGPPPAPMSTMFGWYSSWIRAMSPNSQVSPVW